MRACKRAGTLGLREMQIVQEGSYLTALIVSVFSFVLLRFCCCDADVMRVLLHSSLIFSTLLCCGESGVVVNMRCSALFSCSKRIFAYLGAFL